MKLYLISQSVNNDYDTYDSAVVAAPDEETARNTHPKGGIIAWEDYDNYGYLRSGVWDGTPSLRSWVRKPGHVEVKYLGETEEPQGVICASFNAG